MWITLVSLVFLASLMVHHSERCLDKDLNTWSGMILYMSGLLFQRDIGGPNPQSLGSRTISITVAIFMMIVTTTYIAVLAADNVSFVPKLPITGFDDPQITHPTKQFKFGIVKHDSRAALFENSENPTYRRMWDFMKKYNFKNDNAGFHALKDDRIHAIITTKLTMEFAWKKDKYCNLRCAGKGIQQQGLAMAFPIGSKWTVPISNIIWKYENVGEIGEIKKRWLSSGCRMHTTNNKQFGMLYLSGLCIVLVSGFILSVAALALEHLLSNDVRKRGNRRQRNESIASTIVLKDF